MFVVYGKADRGCMACYANCGEERALQPLLVFIGRGLCQIGSVMRLTGKDLMKFRRRLSVLKFVQTASTYNIWVVPLPTKELHLMPFAPGQGSQSAWSATQKQVGKHVGESPCFLVQSVN
eukprot:565703-Amphidinium_carterae.1